MKSITCIICSIILTFSVAFAATLSAELASPNAILMERDTGEILYQKDEHKKLPPASVTKIMTLLLVFEAIDSGKISFEDIVTVSDYAASMGGSQVFLEPGEQMTLNDMLKATIISSGNDSAVALAEHIAGSEEEFVARMNKRAEELGMKDTTFKNCTGLDSEGHITSAHDIALMSRELLKHDKIKDYTTIWIDSLRNGAFQLANTNKLIRTYRGITGLKTGSTSVAKYCLSATAERDGMELIAVIMSAPTSKDRFSDAKKLLDFGFSNYSLYNGIHDIELPSLPVTLGKVDSVTLDFGKSPSVLVGKDDIPGITQTIDIPDKLDAPVEKGQNIGSIKITSGEKKLSEIPIIVAESVERLDWIGVFKSLLSIILFR